MDNLDIKDMVCAAKLIKITDLGRIDNHQVQQHEAMPIMVVDLDRYMDTTVEERRILFPVAAYCHTGCLQDAHTIVMLV